MPDLQAIAREIVSGLYWRGRTWEEVRAEVMDDGGLSEMFDTPPCPTADAQMIAGIADGLNTAISQALHAERERCAKIADNAENLPHEGVSAYGGPPHCEYGCSDVIAQAIRDA